RVADLAVAEQVDHRHVGHGALSLPVPWPPQRCGRPAAQSAGHGRAQPVAELCWTCGAGAPPRPSWPGLAAKLGVPEVNRPPTATWGADTRPCSAILSAT